MAKTRQQKQVPKKKELKREEAKVPGLNPKSKKIQKGKKQVSAAKSKIKEEENQIKETGKR